VLLLLALNRQQYKLTLTHEKLGQFLINRNPDPNRYKLRHFDENAITNTIAPKSTFIQTQFPEM